MSNPETRNCVVAWTTVGNPDDAARLAREAVAARLAACAQVEGPVRSFYFWKEAIQDEPEYRIWFKTTPEAAARLFQSVKDLHPYEVPQWVVIPATTSPEYGACLAGECGETA